MRKSRVFVAIKYLSAFIVLLIGTYADDVANLDPLLVLPILAILAGVSQNIEPAVDWLNELRRAAEVRQKNLQLKDLSKKQAKELSDLRDLIVSFLENSEIYQDKVKDYLKLNDDYLCVIKSSEGLKAAYESQTTKTQLPFGKVLSEIPGAIRPFERISLFLIPIRSIPLKYRQSIRKYFDKVVLPKVETEREKYLQTVSKKAAAQVDRFSYKYIAFFLRKDSITHGLKNRKFNKMFNAFIVDEQIGGDLQSLKSELVKIVKTKEIIQLINWSSFAKLNKEQKTLLDYYGNQISTSLTDRKIDKLTDLSGLSPEALKNIIWPIVRHGRKTTQKKVLNLAKKVVAGATGAVTTLRENGVNL